MRILLSTLSMSYLSGAPLYNYELARELKKQGHIVTVVSDWNGPLTGKDGHFLKDNLQKEGVVIKNFGDDYGEQDLIIASELASKQVIDRLPNCSVINVVHSEYHFEDPLPNSDMCA